MDNHRAHEDDALKRQLFLTRIADHESGGPQVVGEPVKERLKDRIAAGSEVAAEVPTVRIAVVDDQEIVRRGIKSLLESRPGWKVVAEGGDGDSAIRIAQELKPDILTIDVSHPGPDGIAVARWVSQNAPKVRLLIVSMHASKQLVRDVLEAGARGYVMMSDAARELVRAIETLLEGKLFFTQAISEILLDGFLETPQPMRAENLLTKREIEIVSLLARGKSNKEIGHELNISPRTVETHRANIMNKLQLPSVQHLVRYALRNKLIEL